MKKSNSDQFVIINSRHASWFVASFLCVLFMTGFIGFWFGRHYIQDVVPIFSTWQAKPIIAVQHSPTLTGHQATIANYQNYAQALALVQQAQRYAVPLRIIKTSRILKNNKPYVAYQVSTMIYATRQELDDVLVVLNNTANKID